MTCKQLARWIDAYLDGELDASVEAEVRAHLDECPDCRAEFGPLVSTVRMLGELPELRAPAGLVEGAMQRLPDGRADLSRLGWLFGTMGAAATALIALVSLWAARELAVGGGELMRVIMSMSNPLVEAAAGWLHIALAVVEMATRAIAQPVGLALLANVVLLGAVAVVIFGRRRLMPSAMRVLA